MNQRTMIATVASALFVSMVVLGLAVTGSPEKARRLESDRTRVDRLAQLHYELESHFQRTGDLPDLLTDLNGSRGRPISGREAIDRDPITGEPFEYRKLDEAKYEICAEFAEDSEARGDMPYQALSFQEHKSGHQCFTQTVRKNPQDGIPHPPF